MDYQDFVLQLDRAAGGPGFVARVLRSPAGEAEAPFVNLIATPELDSLWQVALEARQAERGARDLAPEASSRGPLAAELSLEELGDRLFKALFRGTVHSCWARSLAEATRDPEGGLRLKLQLDLGDPLLAPLAELPWEYLYSLEDCGFLGLQRKTPILRHLRLPLPGGRAPAARPLRLLIVSAQPRSLSHLALENESERIAAALGSLPGVEAVPLRNPTVETLRETLLRREFHILHFMGHGGFDAASGQGVLYFTGVDGSPMPVSGALLASHLAGLDSLRLVFVNACETARAGARAPFAGVATALLRAGLPAVVAMQRPIRDSSALELSRTVYRRLAEGDPIDAAVTEGRLAIVRGRGALLEWGTPVLFLRAEDGRLFDLRPPMKQPQAPTPISIDSSSAQRSNRPRWLLYAVLLAGAVTGGLGFAVKHWPSGIWPVGAVASPQESTTPGAPTTSNFESPTPVNPPEHVVHRKKTPDQDPQKPSAPRSDAPITVSDGSSVTIPGLDAEVGANFYQREGHAFARFWVEAPGQGMLQQQPVFGPGPIEFPAQNGTYHLDVLSLSLADKRATVRLRFVP
jgi:hypothetical protein